MKGMIYCFLWYFSIWAGFLFVICPLLPFSIVFPSYIVPAISVMFSLWEMYSVALMAIIFGTEVHISGDKILSTENSIILLNHRTRVDWNFFWAVMYFGSKPRSHRAKMVLKDPLRHVPSLGWVMQVSGFLYIQRDWQKDKNTMENHLEYYKNLGHTMQILIFPEGTNLSKGTLQKSNTFAEKNNLPKYTYVLHPKTKGFTLLASTMRKNKQLDAIYDITLGYSDNIPQTEYDVLCGVFPQKVHFHVRRYPVNVLPADEKSAEQWLQEKWKIKEQLLVEFYKNENKKSFSSADTTTRIFVTDNPLYLAFLFWLILQTIMFFGFFKSGYFYWWTILHCLFFISLSFISDGVQHIQVSIYRLMRQYGVIKVN